MTIRGQAEISLYFRMSIRAFEKTALYTGSMLVKDNNFIFFLIAFIAFYYSNVQDSLFLSANITLCAYGLFDFNRFQNEENCLLGGFALGV